MIDGLWQQVWQIWQMKIKAWLLWMAIISEDVFRLSVTVLNRVFPTLEDALSLLS